MSKSKMRTFKKILHSGTGRPIEFRTDTKAIFHYEVFLPNVNVDIAGFPESRFAFEHLS